MGTYGITDEDFEDGSLCSKRDRDERVTFEEFLRGFEGDVCAEVVANAWNKLAKKYDWEDKLRVEIK